MIRINKYLSLCGVTSRRSADDLVWQGRVTVNDIVVEKPGSRVDEEHDVVKVDGAEVRPVRGKVYILLYKPRRVMTTLDDPGGRATVRDLLKSLTVRVYPVGRLDYDTEGVLLLTNDGDLAHRLSHPRYQVTKIYEAVVAGDFTRENAAGIEGGIKLEDGAVGRASVRIVASEKRTTRIHLTLTEGRKREVKQLCQAVGHPVRRLRRLQFAGITTHGLKVGGWRRLSSTEVDHLKSLVGL